MKGYKYIFDLWNYYEWTIIFVKKKEKNINYIIIQIFIF